MSGNYNGVPVIAVEPERTCELCGKLAETRPYGPKGENICHDCGKKDRAATERGMHAYLFGERH